MGKNIIDFLEALKNKGYDMVTLNEINEELVVLDIPSAIEEVKKISIKCILDTYFEEITFESENDKVYEVIAL